MGLEQQQKIVIMIGGEGGDFEQFTGQLRNKTIGDIKYVRLGGRAIALLLTFRHAFY